MKKLLLIISLLFLLSGCNTVVNHYTIKDIGIIKDCKFSDRHSYTTMIRAGKAIIPVRHTIDAKYITIIEYEGTLYEIDNEKFYKFSKNMINKNINCNFDIYIYEKGNKNIDLISVEYNNKIYKNGVDF